MTTFDGRVAFVTGGASGIGAASVRQLIAEGAKVVIADRDEGAATALAVELGSSAAACALDVSDAASTSRAVAFTVSTFGRLDIGVNSAGVGVPNVIDLAELSFSEWRRVLDVNLDGVFLSMQCEIVEMLKVGGGSIVNIGSLMSVVGTYGASAYVAAKHGVVGLTKAAALEYAQRGIRVNAVGPGHISTPMFTRRTPAEQADVAAQYPMGRVGTPDEIARFVCFLAGPDAGFATGSYFPVEGGFLAQ